MHVITSHMDHLLLLSTAKLLSQWVRCCKSNLTWPVSLSQKLNKNFKASCCLIANVSNFSSSAYEVDKICNTQSLLFCDGMSLGSGKRLIIGNTFKITWFPSHTRFCCGTSLHALNFESSKLFHTRATAKHVHIILRMLGKSFDIPRNRHESSHS